jgi:hypothetical protein
MVCCRICQKEECKQLFDFGCQPVSHHFLEVGEESETNPMALGQCSTCGVPQLMEPMPAHSMNPMFDWIKFNEPENHLVDIVRMISSLDGITKDSRILGISKHDKPLLGQLSREGFNRLDQISEKNDLGLSQENASEALVQSYLNRKTAASILARKGLFDIVVVRRLLEHAFDVSSLLRVLKSLLAPGGNLVLEVPDCKDAFDRVDVSSLWEEHISYFTENSFERSLRLNELQTVEKQTFLYPGENALVFIAKDYKNHSQSHIDQPSKAELTRASAFVETIEKLRKELLEVFETYVSKGGKIAILGAGHRSCTFLNLLGVGKLLEFVVDDDPNKHSLHMPGCRLPIRNSRSLVDEGISLCLLAINPQSEAGFMNGQEEFKRRGGQFLSISPDSTHALRIGSIAKQVAIK